MYLYHSDNIAARHKKVIENSDLIIKIQDGLSQNDVIILRSKAMIEDYAKYVGKYLDSLLDNNENYEIKESLKAHKGILDNFVNEQLNDLGSLKAKLGYLEQHVTNAMNDNSYQNHPKVQGYFRSIALVIRKILDKILTKAGIDNKLFKPEPKAIMFSLQRDVKFVIDYVSKILTPVIPTLR